MRFGMSLLSLRQLGKIKHANLTLEDLMNDGCPAWWLCSPGDGVDTAVCIPEGEKNVGEECGLRPVCLFLTVPEKREFTAGMYKEKPVKWLVIGPYDGGVLCITKEVLEPYVFSLKGTNEFEGSNIDARVKRLEKMIFPELEFEQCPSFWEISIPEETIRLYEEQYEEMNREFGLELKFDRNDFQIMLIYSECFDVYEDLDDLGEHFSQEELEYLWDSDSVYCSEGEDDYRLVVFDEGRYRHFIKTPFGTIMKNLQQIDE